MQTSPMMLATFALTLYPDHLPSESAVMSPNIPRFAAHIHKEPPRAPVNSYHCTAQVLRANGIKIAADQEVPGIINRRKTGPCPFENAVLHIDTPTEALAAIRQQMARMQAGA